MDTRHSPDPRSLWLIRLLIAALAIVAFEPALRNAYTHDDIAQVEEIELPDSPGGWPLSVSAAWWPNRQKNLWRPVTRLSILVQKAFHQDQPALFYGFNLLLNALAALLLFELVRRLRMGLWPAGIAATLFAVHPLHAEAIHQVVGRAELWAAVWMLLGLWLFVVRGGLRDPWIWCHQPVCYALALGSKEHAVLYPLTLLLAMAALRLRRTPPLPTPRWRRTGLLMGQLAVVLTLFLAGKAAVTGGILEPAASIPWHENPLLGLGLIERLPAVLGIFGYAIAHFIAPVGLCPDYSAQSLPFELGWRWGWSWVGLMLALVCLVYIFRNLRQGGRGWTLAVAGLAAYGLTSNGAILIGTVMAERLWYWPSAAACLGAGWGLTRLGYWLGARLTAKNPEADGRRLAFLGVGLIAACLLSAAWAYAPAWRSQMDYAQWSVERFPQSWRGHVNLAREYYQIKDFEQGLAHARRATAIQPRQAHGWDWVGMNAMFLPSEQPEAERAFAHALELNPTLYETWRHWANLLESQGRRAEAADKLERYLEAGPVTDPGAIRARIRHLRGE